MYFDSRDQVGIECIQHVQILMSHSESSCGQVDHLPGYDKVHFALGKQLRLNKLS